MNRLIFQVAYKERLARLFLNSVAINFLSTTLLSSCLGLSVSWNPMPVQVMFFSCFSIMIKRNGIDLH